MKYFFLFLFFHLSADPLRQTICLNMIVKNESKVIQRCLNSVKPLIDYWVIVDTGSTDGTQELIRECMKDVPGELYQSSWMNFEYNRNEALAFARGKGDYLLFIDADEYLGCAEDFTKPYLTKDFYFATVKQPNGIDYRRTLLINNHLEWEWQGVLHEAVQSPQAMTFEVLAGIINFSNTEEGFRSSDPKKYYKDAVVLEEALKQDPNNSRYVFYLAQSYANAHEFELALQNYEKRATMGGWDQEVFWSLYCAAKLQAILQKLPEIVIQSCCRAYEFRPTRAEPLYQLAHQYDRMGEHSLGYMIARLALSIPVPDDVMYVEKWVYEYGLLSQLADCAYHMGRYEEAYVILQKVLQCKLSQEDRERIERNAELLKSLLGGPSWSLPYQR